MEGFRKPDSPGYYNSSMTVIDAKGFAKYLYEAIRVSVSTIWCLGMITNRNCFQSPSTKSGKSLKGVLGIIS